MTAVQNKPNLLFLCHRIPYPPDKGDKIRSYHWLRALAEAFRAHLVAFVDDPADWAHREKLEQLCSSCSLIPLRPFYAKVRSLRGFLTEEPLSLPYYGDRRAVSAVRRIARSASITHVFVYSSAMARYALTPELNGARCVIDFVDVDSDKWRQYAQHKRGIARWIYDREARLLEAYDFDLARSFDLSLFVSSAEAAWFRARLGDGSDTVTHVSNGVDTTYFDPALDLESPYAAGVTPIVFTGAMDYWANVDAVHWFVREVWPRVRRRRPGAVFYIVGSRPTREVLALAGDDVAVTGRVADVRPYLKHAAVVVAPMRIARGVQNKVLEAMSMARPVIVTAKVLGGISAAPARQVFVADDADQFAQHVVHAIEGAAADVGVAARRFVQAAHAWDDSCQTLLRMVTGEGCRASAGSFPIMPASWRERSISHAS